MTTHDTPEATNHPDDGYAYSGCVCVHCTNIRDLTDALAEIVRLKASVGAARGALLTVSRWDSFASEWLAKHPEPKS